MISCVWDAQTERHGLTYHVMCWHSTHLHGIPKWLECVGAPTNFNESKQVIWGAPRNVIFCHSWWNSLRVLMDAYTGPKVTLLLRVQLHENGQYNGEVVLEISPREADGHTPWEGGTVEQRQLHTPNQVSWFLLFTVRERNLNILEFLGRDVTR